MSRSRSVFCAAAVLAAATLAGCGGDKYSMPAGPTSATVHTQLIDLGTVNGPAGTGRRADYHRRLLELRVQPHCTDGSECEGTYVASFTYRYSTEIHFVRPESLEPPRFEPARGRVSTFDGQVDEVDRTGEQVDAIVTFETQGRWDNFSHGSSARLRAYADGSAFVRWTSGLNGLTCQTPVRASDPVPVYRSGVMRPIATSPVVADASTASVCHIDPAAKHWR